MLFVHDRFIKQDKDGAAVFYIKSYVLAKPPPDIEDVADKSLEDAIEVGAEEVTFDEIRPDLLKVNFLFNIQLFVQKIA